MGQVGQEDNENKQNNDMTKQVLFSVQEREICLDRNIMVIGEADR